MQPQHLPQAESKSCYICPGLDLAQLLQLGARSEPHPLPPLCPNDGHLDLLIFSSFPVPIKAREVKPPEFPLISSRMRETHRRGERGEDEDCFCGLRTYSAS